MNRRPPVTRLAVLFGALFAFSCGGDREDPKEAGGTVPADAAAPSSAVPKRAGDLEDEAQQRGLAFVNRCGEPDKATILEANGAGVALVDLGSDGDLDVVFAQGLASLDALLTGPGADLEVFENDGEGRFQRVPGPGLSGWWTGLAAGDVDGDGDADLVAGGFGSLRVLLQVDGRLVPGAELVPEGPARLVVGEPRDAGAPPGWVTSLALFDADRDGNLDLYAGQYLELDPVDPPLGRLGAGVASLPCRWKGYDVYCGPRGLVAQPDRLLFGRGDGGFVERDGALPETEAGYTLAVGAFDADGDGDTDLVVANDSSPNLLLVNRGDGTFEDFGYEANLAFSADGHVEAGMGVAAADVNRDGRMDLAITNFSDEATGLYFGADVGFSNETFRMGLLKETRRLLSWGTHLVDFDGDGWVELFTANGHVYPQADLENTGTTYGQPDTLWRLLPGRRARPVAAESPCSVLLGATATRGSAVGDVDGDGAPDLVLSRMDGPCALGMNRFANGSRLAVRCLGPSERGDGPRRTPADGIGTRVILVVGEGEDAFALLGEVRTAEGYQSASTPWLHFGLGESETYASLRILWPSGRVEELPGGAADRRLVIREGEGVVSAEDLP